MFDDVVVGGGSAGAILAARLSEDVDRKVLLLEAGPDFPELDRMPRSIVNGYQLASDHDWGLSAEAVERRTVRYPRGKAIGGSSSVNACLWLRGLPGDYDEWARLGNDEWAWDEVLPVFRALESDPHPPDEFHDVEGLVPLRYYDEADLDQIPRFFVDACGNLGFGLNDDHNRPGSTGVGLGPWNIDGEGIRQSTALTHLLPARDRPNLTVRGDCLVNKVVFDGARAIGVELIHGGQTEIVEAARVSLAAGSIGTPAILLRSGVGSPAYLESFGIAPVVGLEGVGKNLIDHAFVGVDVETLGSVVDETTTMLQTFLRYTAPDSRFENDMQTLAFAYLPPGLNLQGALMKPYSRGQVRLSSVDPTVQPEINFNFASHPEDQRRLGDALHLLADLAEMALGEDWTADTITLWTGESVTSAQLRTFLKDRDWIDTHVQQTVTHYVHAVGTARMGVATDPGAVVDQYGRVHGLEQVRIVDASIMPDIPRAGTNPTTLMIGERIAAWMRTETG